jgi:WD40 repeat protein
VRLRSFVEYQGITDFRPYVLKQTATLERDLVYPPSLYVPQRMRFEAGTEQGQTDDAFGQVKEWLTFPDPRFIVILGDFGNGKTFLLHELARRLGGDPYGPTPILIDLRALEKARTVDTLIAQHLAAAGMERIDLAAFRYMLQQGRIVLLFDGFDELALRVSYDRAAEHFETILQATGGDAKVIVTSRTQHFESDKQVRTILYDRARPVPGLRYCKLLSFEEHQIRQFLVNRWGDELIAGEWLELLHDVKDLLGLSENPRMLGFITELDRDELRKTKLKEGGVVSAAKLYQLLLDRWLIFEYERAHLPGIPITLTREERWAAVTAIANRLWQKTEKFLSQPELIEEVTAALHPFRPTPPDVAIATHLVGSGSLLRRDDEGSFSFVHQSVLEWLVARQAAEELRATGSSQALSIAPMSQLMADFLWDLTTREVAVSWATKLLTKDATVAAVLTTNALAIFARHRSAEMESAINLAGQDLRGVDLAEVPLRGADLRGTNLTDQRLRGKDLTSANLEGATLVRADLRHADLTYASLEKADLSEASLLGADVRGARIAGSVWRRAKLVGARFDEGALAREDTWGAAMPEAAVAQSFISAASRCHAVTWSPDGALIATGHDDSVIRIWDVNRGLELRQLTGHQGAVRSISFNRDSRLLVSGSEDRSVRIWDAATGSTLSSFTGHEGSLTSVAFSHDSQRVASGGINVKLHVWDTKTGLEVSRISNNDPYADARGVAFSHDSRWLAVGSHDQSVYLWDTSSGQMIRRFVGHGHCISDVVFSPDSQRLATSSVDTTARLWDVKTGRELRVFTGHTKIVNCIAISHDSQWLATGSNDNTARLWDVGTGLELRQFIGHTEDVTSVDFSPDSRWLITSSYDDTIRLWDIGTGAEIRQFAGNSNFSYSIAISHDSRWLANDADDYTVRLWDTKTGQELRQFIGHPRFVRSLAFSEDSARLASGSNDGSVRLWDTSTGLELHQMIGHDSSVLSVDFNRDGNRLASAAISEVVLWETESGLKLHEFVDEQHGFLECAAAALSDHFPWLAGSPAADKVHLWDINTDVELRQFSGHKGHVYCLAFSHDSRWLATGGRDKTARLWDTSTGLELRQFTSHTEPVRCVTFSHDSRWLATCGEDNTIRLWDTGTGLELFQFTGHVSSVLKVAFSHDSTWLASCSADNTVRFWDLGTRSLKLTRLQFADGWAAFAPDGRYKYLGNLAGGFWYAIGLCRFEPGELDEFLPSICAIPLEEPFY